MKTRKKNICCQSRDISTLPSSIAGRILSLMPIRDALRTSILSKEWRYSWRSMPKLVFTEVMVREPSKYKLANASFHVLMLHNGPTLLEFDCKIDHFHMEPEFTQIMSYLAKGNTVTHLSFLNVNSFYKLPVSFFSLQGLERIYIQNCTFEPPQPFNRFSYLKCISFVFVEVSAKMLQGFFSNCPLLHRIKLGIYFVLQYRLDIKKNIDFVAGGNKFTFVDLFQCVPLIRILDISKYHMKYLCAGVMLHKLPTSLDDLEYLCLDVCLMEQNEISYALCIIRSSSGLVLISFTMYDNEKLPVQPTPTNFFDPQNHLDLELDCLEILEIRKFSNSPLEMEFVKLMMAKSPELEKVRIVLDSNVSVDEELKILRDFVLLSSPRASPSAKLTIVWSF
ncbi:F-box/FBD/LRR-repeat protein At1g13570-like [Bidens hawaiensis]|uniref:F-box/FBD/LRR-repeat protein At1g13570-like n=1 Tax=Bidens hawaiensis TaxID=980011 RepID=UPI004049CB69